MAALHLENALNSDIDDVKRRHEDQLQTYTPLFSPPTPRASPAPGDEGNLRRRSYRASYGAAMGIGGGYGIGGVGVVVPELQDPLSLSDGKLGSSEHQRLRQGNLDTDNTESIQEKRTSILVPVPVPSPYTSLGATGVNANSTLAFFDKFVSEARAASEIKRRSVLDEILLHQDNPLFRSNRSGEIRNGEHEADEHEETNKLQKGHKNTENADEGGEDAQLDRPHQPEHQEPGLGAHTHEPVLEHPELVQTATSSPSSTPKRSPPLSSLQPSLAPPLASTDTANVLPISSSLPSHSSHSTPIRSPYQTLSGLHSRWMSSFLHPPTSSSMPNGAHIPSEFTSSHVHHHLAEPTTTSTKTPSTSAGAHIRTSSSSIGSISSSHIDPITHSSSPFASHVFVPISGAPGFVEERYDWDKGFSNELMKELENVDGNVVAERERRDMKNETDTPDISQPSRDLKDIKTKARETREATIEAKENIVVGNGTTTKMSGKTQLTQTLIAGSGFSRISKKDKDSVTKRTRGVPSSNSSVGSPAIGGSSSKKGYVEKLWNDSLEKAKGNDHNDIGNHEARLHEGRLVSEFIERRLGSVELKGRKEMTTPVLDVVLADLLRTHLPALDRLPKAWYLLYSLDQHGISLNTLYTRCEAHTQSQARLGSAGPGSRITGSGAGIARPGMMVVVKDSGDSLFGIWMGDGIRQSRGKGYYGSGESFMWRYRNAERSTREFNMYKWTGKNKYIALCEPDYISFGGGDGSYGLYLDETLFDGSSAPCPTFDNESLCSRGANKAGGVAFECVGLEVWSVGP